MMRRFEVADRSMEPFLAPGDWVVAWRRPVRRGDVVIFEHPHRAGFHLVKRVVGMESETVEIRDGTVLVDGHTNDPLGDLLHTEPPGRWTIPVGKCFVLSDARTATVADSRTFGPVATLGMRVVRFRYWPPGRVGGDFRPVA